MAAVRGGRGGIEDELVGAAVQISELRQEKKRLQRALDSALIEVEEFKKIRLENSRQIQEHETRRAEAAATHAKELEDVKKNEREAIETAKEACAELQKRNEENAKLKAELSEARAAAAEAALTGGPANRRKVTATGLKPVSPGPAAAGGAGATPGRRARYAMDGEEDSNGGAADRTKKGGGSGGEEDGEGEEEDDDDEDDDEEEEEEEEDDGKKGTGFFGWLTGSAKKRRRGV